MIVYILVNSVNCKAYVGQHRGNSLTKRWNKNLSNAAGNGHLAAAIAKYGPSAFTREILAYCSTQEEADNLERLWIATLRTHDPAHGYNIQMGGLGARQTPEIRQRISKGRKLFWQNLSNRQKKAFAAKMRKLWRSRTAGEIASISRKISSAMIRLRKTVPPWVQGRVGPNAGKPSPRKGRPSGKQQHPFKGPYPAKSELTKRRIRAGLRRYWAQKNAGSTQVTFDLTGGKQWRYTKVLNMAKVATTKQFIKLGKEAVEIIQQAFDSLERGGSVQDAKSRLKEIGTKLTELEWEYKGECRW